MKRKGNGHEWKGWNSVKMIVETPISFIKSDPKKGANQVGIGRVTLASIGGEMLTLKIIFIIYRRKHRNWEQSTVLRTCNYWYNYFLYGIILIQEKTICLCCYGRKINRTTKTDNGYMTNVLVWNGGPQYSNEFLTTSSGNEQSVLVFCCCRFYLAWSLSVTQHYIKL